MALAFRNLDIGPSAPVAEWPTEAVLTALERGDLSDWRRLATEIRRDPWGPTARQVEECLGHSRPYGAAELMEGAIARARAAAETSERAEVATTLAGLVERSGLSRTQFARQLGTSGSRLSTYLTGSVVPSATLMVRASRIADRIAAQS